MKNQMTFVLKAASMALVFSMAPVSGVQAQGIDHVSAGEMEGHCRIEAASSFDLTPANIMIGRPQASEGGGMTIRGTADDAQGAGMQSFTCNYDADGRFVNVSG